MLLSLLPRASQGLTSLSLDGCAWLDSEALTAHVATGLACLTHLRRLGLASLRCDSP